MKSRIPFEKRNPAGAVAAKREIQRQLVETGKEYELEVDALFCGCYTNTLNTGLVSVA